MSAALKSVDAGQTLFAVGTMDSRLADYLAPRQFAAMLVACFAAFGSLLAVVGIYGVISYAVSHRTREIGIRIAVGAEPKQILRMVLRQGLVLAGVGALLGVSAAWTAAWLMRSALENVGSLDPTLLGSATALLVMAGLAGSLLPARRAAGLHAWEALRHDG